MSPTVSVVMTTYKRDRQLWRSLLSVHGADEIIVVDDANDPATERLCRDMATYIPRLGRPDVPYSNPAVPINIGLSAAKGDIVVLQNAECEHLSDVTEQFRICVREGVCSFAKVASLRQDGSFDSWYCSPETQRPYFFCGAMLRKHFLELGGMDEAFVGPGYEDDDFAARMQKAGIRFDFSDTIRVNHQWHERDQGSPAINQQLFHQKHGAIGWSV